MNGLVRAAQALYDCVYDATGILVGTYRCLLTVALYAAGTALVMWWADLPVVLYTLLSLTEALLLGYAYKPLRLRVLTDNSDQRAGRYDPVNTRAEHSRRNLASHVMFSVAWDLAVCVAVQLAVGKGYVLLPGITWVALGVNSCLRVRERRPERFTMTSHLAPSGGTA